MKTKFVSKLIATTAVLLTTFTISDATAAEASSEFPNEIKISEIQSIDKQSIPNTTETLKLIEDLSNSPNPSLSYSQLTATERMAVDKYTTVTHEKETFVEFSPLAHWETYTAGEKPLPARAPFTPSATLPYCRSGAATSGGYNAFNQRVRTVTVEGRWCEHRGKVVSAEILNHYASTSLPGTTYSFNNSGTHISHIVATRRANMMANYSFSIVWNGVLAQNLCARLHGYINGITTQDTSCSVL